MSQNIPSKSSRRQILLKDTWDIFQNTVVLGLGNGILFSVKPPWDHMLGHNTNLNKFTRIEIISSIFSGHNGMKINYMNKTKKLKNIWKLDNIATEQQMGQGRNQKRSKKVPQDKWKCKYNIAKFMGFSKCHPKREIHSNTHLPQETRQVSNKQPNYTSKS